MAEAEDRKMVIPNADILFPRETLRSLADTVALSRALEALKPLPYPLVVAQGAAFDIGATSWCILFGSDDEDRQQIHWKNLFDEEDFRSGLLKSLGIGMADWTTYWNGLVTYRNELVAHRDLDPKTRHYPNFEFGLRAASYYHERLIELAAKRGLKMEGPTLIEHYERRLAEFTDQMKTAIAAL